MDRTFGYFNYPGVEADYDVKLNSDRYEVYVNGDFIGYKTLFGLNEDISDVDDFLYEQGINKYQARVEGDHYIIETDQVEDLGIKQILSVYLEAY